MIRRIFINNEMVGWISGKVQGVYILELDFESMESLPTKCNRVEARDIFKSFGFNNPDNEEYFKEYEEFNGILKDLEKLFKKIFKGDVSMIIKEGFI